MIDEQSREYLLDLTPRRDTILTEMEAIAREKEFPIIGPMVGRLLYQLTRLSRAKRVFEMGSGFGYSTLWFARALPSDGVVFYTDDSEEHCKMAKDFLERAGVGQRVDMRTGDAIEILKAQSGPFDIILNDIDKESYPSALPIALDKLKTNGLLITDNILWKGKVAAGDTDPSTVAIRRYTRSLYDHPKLYTTVVPIRDGVSISIKMP